MATSFRSAYAYDNVLYLIAGEVIESLSGQSWEEFQTFLANMSHPRRTQTLAEVATAAAFLASDHARGLTGTTVNLTMGGAPD